ncbi:MAG: SoxR reducing system RseC family protein [Eubacteriaceae bacterium]|nr:SoxR reducing system RseC family protein [Eubacteriaceae bacterium]MBR0384462.1 SoxR reducing system RseC family protein [Eubacteriaceae bacterium]
MRELGIVKKTKGKTAKVVIQRHAACGDCKKCDVSKDKSTMTTEAINRAKAKEGEAVAVEMSFNNVMKASGIAYGIPCAAFILGCFLGFYLLPQWGADATLGGFLSGVVLTVLAYLVIHLADRRGAFAGRDYAPVITEILSEEELETLKIDMENAKRHAAIHF